jgi:hypothetical protein
MVRSLYIEYIITSDKSCPRVSKSIYQAEGLRDSAVKRPSHVKKDELN